MMKKHFKKLRLFLYKLWYEKLKISYKPVQYYYTNKIQDSIEKHKNVGSGKVFVFSNKLEALKELQKLSKVSSSHFFQIEGFPCIEMIGSKIHYARAYSKDKNLTREEIIKTLKNQKSDKI